MEYKKTNKHTDFKKTYLKILFRLLISFILVVVILNGTTVNAQSKSNEPRSWEERFYFGGQLGLGSEWGQTHIFAAPIAGYDFFERKSKFLNEAKIGMGPLYNYYKAQFINQKGDHVFGAEAFVRVNIYRNIYAQLQYERLFFRDSYLENYEIHTDQKYKSFPVYIVGAGYNIPVMHNGQLNLSLLWDLASEDYIPYDSPMIRIGFNYYFNQEEPSE